MKNTSTQTSYRVTWTAKSGCLKHIDLHSIESARQLVENLQSNNYYDVQLHTKRQTFVEIVINFAE